MTIQKTYARVAGNTAVETYVPPDGAVIEDCFHGDVLKQFVECPADTRVGATLDDAGVWTQPALPPAPPPPQRPDLTPIAFYLAFKPQERIAIKTSADPIVKEFWETYQLAAQTNSPIQAALVSVQSGVAYLRQQNILATDERIDEILDGVPQ
jgi:hypothetical protein